jgi:Domain of unknown function (DUF4232)
VVTPIRSTMSKVVPVAAVTFLIGGGLLGACSSNSSSPTTSSVSTTTGRSATTGAAPSTSTTTGGPTTTAATGPVRCATAALTGSVVGGSGAAGTIETTMALRSTAAVPCTLGGYPGLQMLAASGAALPTIVVRKGSYSFTSMAPATVTLAPGQSVYFNIGYSDVPVGSETACPTSASVEVTPPNAFDHLVTPAALGPCAGGTLVVSPVFLATGANSQTTAPPN